MEKIIPVNENSFIYNTSSPVLNASSLVTKINDHDVVIVDTGCNDFPELFDELEKNKLRVCAAVCTHLHWDHVKNNAEIIRRGGTVYASRLEVNYPDPFVKPRTDGVTLIDGNILNIQGSKFELIPTPGHSPGHVAVKTPDSVCFIGDAILAEAELSVSKLPYFDDIQDALISMDKLRDIDSDFIVAAHTGVIPCNDFQRVVDLNIQKELDIYDNIRKFVKEPVSVDDLPAPFMRSIGILKPIFTSSPVYHYTVKRRVMELVKAGELGIENNIVFPIK